MQSNLPTCPKCGDQADDVGGRVCGHPVHEPWTRREDARLEVLAAGGTMAEADAAGQRAYDAAESGDQGELVERLRAVLDPQTGTERTVVEWLGRQWDGTTLELLTNMIERCSRGYNADVCHREGFDAGFEAGAKDAMARGGTAIEQMSLAELADATDRIKRRAMALEVPTGPSRDLLDPAPPVRRGRFHVIAGGVS